MLVLKYRKWTQIWRVHSVLLTTGAQSCTNTTSLHTRLAPFGLHKNHLQIDLPLECVVRIALIPIKKSLIVVERVLTKQIFAYSFPTRLTSMWDTQREKCIVRSLFPRNWYSFADVYLAKTILFQSATSDIFDITCLCFSTSRRDLFLQKVNIGQLLLFDSATKMRYVRVSILFLSCVFHVQWIRMWTYVYGRSCYRKERWRIWQKLRWGRYKT